MAKEVKVFVAYGTPISHRAELALRLKGVPYEALEEDLANKSELLLKYNPIHKKVPVLLHGKKPIAESLVIIEYIDETFDGDPILPTDPYERAMARFWARFIDEKCISSLWMSCWTDGDTEKNLIEQSEENLSILEGLLRGKRFFGGDLIGLVDIGANYVAYWFMLAQEVAGISLINEQKHPILCRWAKDFVSSPVVASSLPTKERLLPFLMAQKEAVSAKKV